MAFSTCFAVSQCALLPFLLQAPRARAAGRVEDTLVIITPHWEGIRKEHEAGFKEWLRAKKRISGEVKLQWFTGQGSSDIQRQIESDFLAKRPPKIDVVFGGGLENFMSFAKKGYLQKTPLAAASKIPAELRGVPLRDKDDLWFGAALSAFGVMYNKRVLAKEKLPTPKEWADLARPVYAGRVGVVDPRHSGSFLMSCEIMLQASGWDRGWQVLTGMFANSRSVAQAASQVPRDVARGECALGAVIDFYARQEMSQAPPGDQTLGYVIPTAQTVITPDPIAALRGAPHPVAAALFIEYVITDGQKLLMLPQGAKDGPKQFTLGRLAMIPALYDVSAKSVVGDTNPFTASKGLAYDEEKGSSRRKLLSDLIGALLIDQRSPLQAAWKHVGPKKIGALARPPLTEVEATALSKKWDDAVFRNEMLGKWARFAREKYARS